MKKFFNIVCVLCIVLSLSACGTEEKGNPVAVEEQGSKEIKAQAGEIEVSSIEELNEVVPREVEAHIAALNEKYEKLTGEIDTYE